MNPEEFGHELAHLLECNDIPAVLRYVHGIDLPAGWQVAVAGLLRNCAGLELDVEVVDAAEIPEQQMHWLRKAPPDLFATLTQAVRLRHEARDGDDVTSDELLLPIVPFEGGYRILMVGAEG